MDYSCIVRDRCRFQSARGFSYEVRSGERFIDLNACRRCLCENGEPRFCEELESSFCHLINPPSNNCTMSSGKTVSDGDSVDVNHIIMIIISI